MKPFLLAPLLVAALASPASADVLATAKRDYQAADAKLNEMYHALTLIGMPEATRKQLMAAEVAWIKYRDADGAFAADWADADKDAARYRRLAELTRERTTLLQKAVDEANGD